MLASTARFLGSRLPRSVSGCPAQPDALAPPVAWRRHLTAHLAPRARPVLGPTSKTAQPVNRMHVRSVLVDVSTQARISPKSAPYVMQARWRPQEHHTVSLCAVLANTGTTRPRCAENVHRVNPELYSTLLYTRAHAFSGFGWTDDVPLSRPLVARLHDDQIHSASWLFGTGRRAASSRVDERRSSPALRDGVTKFRFN